MMWHLYTNGNYFVRIDDETGTKIRETIDPACTYWDAEFPESIDLHISDKCENGCPYCFVAGTKVLMSDFTHKNIEDVKVGDEVIGFPDDDVVNSGFREKKTRFLQKTKVSHTFVRSGNKLLEITTASGNRIITTPEHPFLTEFGTGKGHAQRFNEAKTLSVGKNRYTGSPYVVGFPKIEIDYLSRDYKIGYCIGSWSGDGSLFSGKKDRYLAKCRFVTLDEEINDKVYEITNELLGQNLFYRKDYAVGNKKKRSAVMSNKIESLGFLYNLIFENVGVNKNIGYVCGFLAGIFDSEGRLDTPNNTVRIYNTNIVIIKEIERCLKNLGLKSVREITQHETPTRKKCYGVRVTGKFGWYQFLWYARPVCPRKTLDSVIFDSKTYLGDEIVSIREFVSHRNVYNLETECHTYIANNFMVHNCYANCTPRGQEADLLNVPVFFKTLRPYTELAINVNSEFAPSFGAFLGAVKNSFKLISNITINQQQFMLASVQEKLKDWSRIKWLHGIGVSLTDPTPEFIDAIKQFPNAVIHTVAGITTRSQYQKLLDNDLKILILGYKFVGRGKDWYENGNLLITDKSQMKEEATLLKETQARTSEIAEKLIEEPGLDISAKFRIDLNIEWLRDNLLGIMPRCKLLSFDGLALEQLDVKNQVPKKDWDERYMGDEGQHTMFIDLVKKEYGMNSLSTERFPVKNTIEEMFSHVKQISKESAK